MEDFDLPSVARKSVRGVFALVSRTFFVQILSIVTFLVISARLDPSIFGIFIIAQSIIVFFNYFQDVGLAASLVQKKEEPKLQEYRAVFTTQQILVLLLVIPAIIFSGQIADFYNLDSQGQLLFISLLVSFFLTSLRTIPSVMLERKLDFGKLVIPQIGENVVYNIFLIVFVILGFDILSFTLAVLFRSIVGLILTYIVQPWKVGITFHLVSLKKLFSFGIPFQANNVLALIKDDLLVVYLGKILPFAQVGYIGFAQKIAFYPLRLVMDNVIRITFPSYSRLQHDQEAMKIAIEKSLFFISFFVFPSAFAIMLFSESFLEVFPRYSEYLPAVVSIMFFAANTMFSSISTPLTNFLNAIGKVKITLYFMAFWTTATWVLTYVFINHFGYNGVAMASFAVSVTSLGVFVVAKKYVKFLVFRPIFRQLIAAIIMALFILGVKGFISGQISFVFAVVAAGLVYATVIFFLAKSELVKISKFVYHSIRHDV